jgi:hypothetical protein
VPLVRSAVQAEQDSPDATPSQHGA